MCFIFVPQSSVAQNQKLKNKNDSLKFEQKTLEFEALFIKANLQKNKSDYSQALAMYFDCLKILPKSSATLYEIAQIYKIQSKFNESIKSIEKAIKYNPKIVEYHLFLADLYDETEDYQKQVDQLQIVLKTQPNNLQLYYRIADIYLDYSQFQKSLQVIENLESKFGSNEETLNTKVRIYYAIRDYSKMISQLNILINQYPQKPEYKYQLASTYLAQSNTVSAMQIYNSMLSQESNSSEIHIQKARIFASQSMNDSLLIELNTIFGMPYINGKKKLDIFNSLVMESNSNSEIYKNRLLYAQQLLKQYPDDIQLHKVITKYYFDNVTPQLALPNLYKIIAVDKSDYSYFENIIEFEENLDSVISVCKQAIEVYPNNSKTYWYLGIAYMEKKQYYDAIPILQQGLDITYLKSQKIDFYSSLGESYYYIDSIPASDLYFNKALAIDSLNLKTVSTYAYILALRNVDQDKAQHMLDICLNQYSINYENYITQAILLCNQQKYSEALIEIEKANNKDETPLFYEHYGDILFLNNRVEEAEIQWKKANEKGALIDIQRKKVILQKK